MHELIGRVAVITGATNATGIGLAERAAREGMCVVIADAYPASLGALAARLGKAGAEVLAVPVDVSLSDDVAELARRAVAEFGAVHLLFNNAGLDVWSVVHALRVFVPMMIEQGDHGHIVNTASLSELLSLSRGAPLQASIPAVVSLTEDFDRNLRRLGSALRASVLCAGGTTAAAGCGLLPKRIADAAFAGIAANQLYIIPDPQLMETARARLEAILGALPVR